MCGFCGFLSSTPQMGNIDDLLKKMGDSIIHRGPDDSGEWHDQQAGVGLSHRRLSIIDLSADGHQPMVSHSGRFVMAYNGEIYNYQSLREDLLAVGSSFRGRSDTEVLLSAIECWGIQKALRRSVGMFAFALWDKKSKTLMLARDRMGEKPLYYGWQGVSGERTFLFGSELKALRQHPSWQGGVDRNSLANLLRYNYIPEPQTIHPGIYKLPPGHIMHLAQNEGGWEERMEVWWSLQAVSQQATEYSFKGGRADAVEELDELLREVIREQCLADVPLGAFLSGGVDSTSVVGVMQSISNDPVNTFTIGFEDQAYDESVHARRVAAHLGTEHREWIITADDALSVIPDLPSLYDEPFADVSQIPTLLLSRLARNSVTVALSGDGGDELFAGYNRHQWAPSIMQKMGYIPQTGRQALARLAVTPSPQAWDYFFQKVDNFLPTTLKASHPGEKIHKIASILNASGERDIYSCLVRVWDDPVPVLGGQSHDLVSNHQSLWGMGDNFIDRMTRLDSVTYLPDDILVKVDRAAMSASLETRVPFLDHRLVEFSAMLPLSMKIHDGSGKWVLREVLDRYVPRELIERPKIGFGLPIHDWLRGPLRAWAEELLSEQRLLNEGYFDVATIRDAWEKHLSGKYNLQYPLWGVLMFQAWNH